MTFPARFLAWWETVTWYRRILLIAQLLMILGFAVALSVVRGRPGFAYGDAVLLPHAEGEDTVYAGRVDGERAAFTVSPDGRVGYTWGDFVYGPYTVREDPSAVPEEYDWTRGVEIREGDQVLFRGGYTGQTYPPLFTEAGEAHQGDISFTTVYSNGEKTVYSSDGEPLTAEDLHAPGPAVLARLVLDPALRRRGSVSLFLLVTLLAALNLAAICFPNAFFRLSLWGHVKNLEEAEPSDYYLFCTHVGWLLLAVIAGVLYWRVVFSLF